MQRLLITVGLLIALIGLLWPWVSRLPLGRLPVLTGPAATAVLSSHTDLEIPAMARTPPARCVKKAISLPPDLAQFAMATAREEGKTLSAVVQDAMRAYRLSRLKGEYRELQDYWSRRARDKGVLTERRLERYLARKD